jgi:branched-subunit amino acid aminotransferase/4-amino-4-deoxychorismate lyase
VSVGGDFYQFVEGELSPLEMALDDSLAVADSFLVQNGTVRALDRHFARFASSISNQKTRRQLPGFFASAAAVIPHSGDWFPRLEYREGRPDGQKLFLRIRTAPERTETVRLWTLEDKDPRTNPFVKGPDLAICQQLRRAANLHGADEAVLVTEDGFIADGALSSIVWWENETLFGPDDTTPWLPSITRELIFELASQAGYQTSQRRARPAELAGCEVWSLSALQGIRAVEAWEGVAVAPARLASPFSKRLAMLAQPLPSSEEVLAMFSEGF